MSTSIKTLKYLFIILFVILALNSCNFVINIIDENTINPEEQPGEITTPPTDYTPVPTGVPTSDFTPIPTAEITAEPSTEPTPDPTIEPTFEPTIDPTAEPTPGSSGNPYEIIFNAGIANGWFGGDDGTPRNVGYGQGVYIDNNVMITDFSFYYSTRFDYPASPEYIGHEVTLRLHIRDIGGTIMTTYDIVVPDTFNGGWVTWSGLNWPAGIGETLIFTAYLVDGYSNMLSSSALGDSGAGYTLGQRYSNSGTTDATMDEWANWSVHSWDSWFWLQGIVQ